MELKTDPALPGAIGGFARRALRIGVLTLAGSIAAGIARPDQFFRSYLLAFVFWNGLAVGSLAVLMLQYLTGGAWGIVIRRELEAATRTFWLTALAFLPLVLGMPASTSGRTPTPSRTTSCCRRRRSTSTRRSSSSRTAVYFAAWMLIAYFLNRWSREQDTHADHGGRPQARSCSRAAGSSPTR